MHLNQTRVIEIKTGTDNVRAVRKLVVVCFENLHSHPGTRRHHYRPRPQLQKHELPILLRELVEQLLRWVQPRQTENASNDWPCSRARRKLQLALPIQTPLQQNAEAQCSHKQNPQPRLLHHPGTKTCKLNSNNRTTSRGVQKLLSTGDQHITAAVPLHFQTMATTRIRYLSQVIAIKNQWFYSR